MTKECQTVECKSCGRQINTEEDYVFAVNLGIPGKEFAECELCHAASLDSHKIIMCDACGEYFSSDALREEEVCGQSFCACPSCGKDIVEGMTREEFEREFSPAPVIKIKEKAILKVNNRRQIVLEQARTDGDITVTTWGVPTKDGIMPCEAEYTISVGDFVSMLNWYKYQKRNGNENLLF